MIFNSLTYLVFLAIVVPLYWVLPRVPKLALIFLAGIVFYGFWRFDFLAVLFIVAQVVGPQAARVPQDDPFVASCTSQCVATSGGQQACRKVCLCISGEIRKEPMIWQRLVGEGLSPADHVTIDGFTRQCVARTR